MVSNEKIVAIATAAVAVGSVALFAVRRAQSRKYTWHSEVEMSDKNSPTTTITE